MARLYKRLSFLNFFPFLSSSFFFLFFFGNEEEGRNRLGTTHETSVSSSTYASFFSFHQPTILKLVWCGPFIIRGILNASRGDFHYMRNAQAENYKAFVQRRFTFNFTFWNFFFHSFFFLSNSLFLGYFIFFYFLFSFFVFFNFGFPNFFFFARRIFFYSVFFLFIVYFSVSKIFFLQSFFVF